MTAKRAVKVATDRAAAQAASRGSVVVRPGAALLGELGLSVALHASASPESLVWMTPALAVSAGALSLLLWQVGRDKSLVGRILAIGSTALTGVHLIAASILGPFSDSLLGPWMWVGGTLAAAWVIRLWVARGDAVVTDAKRRVSLWDEVTAKAGGALEGAEFQPKQVNAARMKGPLQLERGQTVDDAQDARKTLASLLGLPPNGVRITPDPDDASRGELTLTRKDMLRNPVDYEAPSALGGTVVEPYLMGFYESGEPAHLHTHIPGRGEMHLLIQGMNGAGKTKAAQLMLAEEFTRRENFTIYIDTVKGAQSLGPVARGLRWVIQTESEAAALMRKLVKDVIPARAHYLGRKGLENWQPGCGIPRLVVHVEEGSGLFLGNKDFTRALERIRSVGIQFRLSGQRFSWTAVDVSARAQFAGVMCFGVAELDDARFVMPETALDAGADPSQWKNEQPGCAYLIGPGTTRDQQVTAMRTLRIEREQLEQLARYAEIHGEELDDLTANAFGELYRSRVPVQQLLEQGPRLFGDDEDDEARPAVAGPREEEEEEVPGEDRPEPFRPSEEDPEPDVQPGIDDPMPEVEDMPIGVPPVKLPPEQAREMFDTRMRSLQGEGVEVVTAKHMVPIAQGAGYTAQWGYKQLARLVESGHLERTDAGWRFARVLANA